MEKVFLNQREVSQMTFEAQGLRYDGQADFSGGAHMVFTPPGNGYRWAKNIVIRDGHATIRPGVRTAFRATTAGFQTAFYFNQDNVKYNDASHTGFWFDGIDFVGSVWGTIQGMGLFRFLGESKIRTLIATDGRVYVHNDGYAQEVTTSETISTSEVISFVQAGNFVFMFRGEDNNVLYWNGSSDGFINVPAGYPQSIVNADTATYMAQRLWIHANDNDLYASDLLAPTNYEYVYQKFTVGAGENDQIVKIVPYHDNNAFLFRKNSIYFLSGINSVVQDGTYLSNYISIGTVDTRRGMVGKNAYAIYGENIAFLGYNGIYDIRRNEWGNYEGLDVPLSAEIEPLIDRINWDYAHLACAENHNNYLLFAVPIDGSTYNNTVLVYDLLRKSWIPEWKSEMIKPVQFYRMNEKLFFLNNDGRLKQMFTNDPWDSEDVFADTPIYDSSTYYNVGEHAYQDVSGEDKIFNRIRAGSNNDVTDTDYWEEVTDPQHVYDIESEIWTRFLDLKDKTVGKKWQRGEIILEHQYPKITVDIEGDTYGVIKNICTDKEYDYTEYDVCDKEDWDTSNINLDFHEPYRKDYPLIFTNNDADIESAIFFVNGFPDSSSEGSYTFKETIVTTNTTHYYELDDEYKLLIRDFPSLATVVFITKNGTPLYLWDTSNYGDENYVFDNISTVSWKAYPSLSSVDGSIVLKQKSLLADANGLTGNIWTPHPIRFIPLLVNDKEFSLRIKNTRGKLMIKSIRESGTHNRFSFRST